MHQVEDQARYDATKAESKRIWEQSDPHPAQDMGQAGDRRKRENSATREAVDNEGTDQARKASRGRRSMREKMHEKRTRRRGRKPS